MSRSKEFPRKRRSFSEARKMYPTSRDFSGKRVNEKKATLFQKESGITIFGKYPVLLALQNKSVQPSKIVIADSLRDNQFQVKIETLAREQKIPMQTLPRHVLESTLKLTGETHQGFVLLAKDFQYSSLEQVFQKAELKNKKPLLVVLDRIQDPHNVGAIIRSSVSLGADAVVFEHHGGCAITGTIFKTSAGLVSSLPIVKVGSLRDCIILLKKKGYQVVALDFPAEKSLEDCSFEQPTALIVGNEGEGIHPVLRKLASTSVEIFCPGKNQSLNVSVATAIALYECARQRKGVIGVGSKDL